MFCILDFNLKMDPNFKMGPIINDYLDSDIVSGCMTRRDSIREYVYGTCKLYLALLL